MRGAAILAAWFLRLGARAAASLCNSSCQKPPAKVLYEWVELDYKWPGGETEREVTMQNGMYIPHNCVITGVKTWQDTFWVTVMRGKPGVPGTLAKVVTVNGKAVLDPYPSWEYQTVGEPWALQFVQSMEIDSRGRMWIIDVGRAGNFGKNINAISGIPKIVVWDILNHKLLWRYEFPDHVAPHNSSSINDIVVDEEHNMAYLTDVGLGGAILIYNASSNTSYRWTSPTMKVEPFDFKVMGVDYGSDAFNLPVDGIALSNNTLFYCPLHGTSLYAISTEVLRTMRVEDLDKHVEYVGAKPTATGGMVFVEGNLIYGGLTNDAVYSMSWKSGARITSDNQEVIAQCDESLHWPDTFAKGQDGTVYVTSNKLERFLKGTMDFSGAEGPNFRIVQVLQPSA